MVVICPLQNLRNQKDVAIVIRTAKLLAYLSPPSARTTARAPNALSAITPSSAHTTATFAGHNAVRISATGAPMAPATPFAVWDVKAVRSASIIYKRLLAAIAHRASFARRTAWSGVGAVRVAEGRLIVCRMAGERTNA